MFKLYHPKKEQTQAKTPEKEIHSEEKAKSETKTKRPRKVYPGREDGGPSTRSKTAQEKDSLKKSYADQPALR